MRRFNLTRLIITGLSGIRPSPHLHEHVCCRKSSRIWGGGVAAQSANKPDADLATTPCPGLYRVTHASRTDCSSFSIQFLDFGVTPSLALRAGGALSIG